MDVNLDIRELKSPEDLEKHYKLRHEVYVLQKGWETENGAGLEIDGWDQFSHHFGAFYDDELVATLRLIDGRKTDLPIFTIIPPYFKQKNAFEISRVICKKINGIPAPLVMGFLYHRAYIFAVNNNYQYVYAVMRESHYRAWKKLPLKQIGTPFKKKNETLFVPTIAKISEVIISISTFLKKNSRKWINISFD